MYLRNDISSKQHHATGGAAMKQLINDWLLPAALLAVIVITANKVYGG
jgi:hypothetical protein